MQVYGSLIILILGLMPLPDRQGSLIDLKQSLNAKYEGKIVTLRHFYSGSILRFTQDGNLSGSASEGPWTTCARVEIDKLDLNSRNLTLEGRRWQ